MSIVSCCLHFLSTIYGQNLGFMFCERSRIVLPFGDNVSSSELSASLHQIMLILYKEWVMMKCTQSSLGNRNQMEFQEMHATKLG